MWNGKDVEFYWMRCNLRYFPSQNGLVHSWMECCKILNYDIIEIHGYYY